MGCGLVDLDASEAFVNQHSALQFDNFGQREWTNVQGPARHPATCCSIKLSSSSEALKAATRDFAVAILVERLTTDSGLD